MRHRKRPPYFFFFALADLAGFLGAGFFTGFAAGFAGLGAGLDFCAAFAAGLAGSGSPRTRFDRELRPNAGPGSRLKANG